MQNYEAKKASYFATPSPQLIHALHTSLTQILSKPLSERFAAHRAASQKVKKAVSDLGLKQLASDPADQANGMTAIYLPENVTAAELLPNLLKKGVIFAGGLHKQIATKYFRVGHMGVSVVSTFPPRSSFQFADHFRLTLTVMTLIARSQRWVLVCQTQVTKRLSASAKMEFSGCCQYLFALEKAVARHFGLATS